MYELMGRAHAALARERGQGTVEYVGLILLLAMLLAGVVAASKNFKDTGDRQRGGEQAQVRDRHRGGKRLTRAAPPGGPARLAAWSRRPFHRPRPTRCAGARSACSTRASAGSRCCTSCSSSCPHEDFLYFADSARCPTAPRQRGGDRGVLARDRRGAARARHQAARGRLQHRVGGGAAGAARAADADDARRRRARRGPARARCRRWPRPATAASGCWPRQATVASGAYERAIAAADPFVDRDRGGLPGPRADDRARLPVRRADGRGRARATRAAARGAASTR